MPDLNDIFSAAEAARLWGLEETTVKKACQAGRFLPDEYVKKGRDWLVTREGMERLYGPQPRKEY
jgi:hypothetical protein